jgi:hypothetical protein
LFWSFGYLALRCLLQLVLLHSRSESSKGLEIVVLSHELSCGVRNGSCGDAVFVDEAAESIAAVESGSDAVNCLEAQRGRIRRRKVA